MVDFSRPPPPHFEEPDHLARNIGAWLFDLCWAAGQAKQYCSLSPFPPPSPWDRSAALDEISSILSLRAIYFLVFWAYIHRESPIQDIFIIRYRQYLKSGDAGGWSPKVYTGRRMLGD